MPQTIPETMTVPRFVGDSKIIFAQQPVPRPGPGQLLIQVKCNALCGSDRKQFLYGTDIIPGHEASGIVIDAGPDTKTPVGTPGVIFLMDTCGECDNCTKGYTNQCSNKRADMGFNKDGGYVPYELISERIFFKIDENIPLTEATLLLDIMGTTSHAIRRGQLVRKDISSVLVAGAGPIGLGVLAMCKIILGKHVPVIISDVVPYRLELAKKLGGLPVNLKETSLADGLRAHGFTSADVAFDTSGKTVARQDSISVLSQRGVLVCIGHGEEIHLNVSDDLITPERAVLASEYFTFEEIAGNLEYLRIKENQDYLKQIITHRFGVEDIQHAYELFFKGDTGKVVIEQ
jgi:threonine 3-dehydrogenase